MTVRLMLSGVVRDENDSSPKTPKPDHSMPTVEKELNKKGDFLVDYEEKVFPDIKADPGEKALVTFHTVAFEGSIRPFATTHGITQPQYDGKAVMSNSS